MGHYAEMEKYYRSLPEAEILASPSLMQGMSMLCALAMDYEARSTGTASCKHLPSAAAGRTPPESRPAAALHGWTFLSLSGA